MDCSSSTAVPVIPRGDPDIFMATACGGGWALCRGLESPPLLFLPLQSWFGGGVIGDSLTAAWTSDQIEKLIAVRTPTERQWARCPTYWAKSKTTEGKL